MTAPTPFHHFGRAVAIFVALVALIAAVWAITYYLGIFGNNVSANFNKRVVTAQVQQKVRTPDFAQATYEQFFNDCNAVVADNAKIELASQRVAAIKAGPDDQFGQKAARLSDAISDLTGVQQAQVETAARYNANASEYTRGQFLDRSLPPRINPPFTSVSCGQEVTP
jgi:hypothetical protein